MLFPSPSASNTDKDAPNHIPENMIGYAHTLLEIQKDSYIPILPEILFAPTRYGITILVSSFTDDRS